MKKIILLNTSKLDSDEIHLRHPTITERGWTKCIFKLPLCTEPMASKGPTQSMPWDMPTAQDEVYLGCDECLLC